MCSFLLFPRPPKLRLVLDVLKKADLNPSFHEDDKYETIVFRTEGLDCRIWFDLNNHHLMALFINRDTQTQLTSFSQAYPQSVTAKDLLQGYQQANQQAQDRLKFLMSIERLYQS